MSNIVWAFAHLQLFDMPLLAALASQSIRSISHFSTQELSNTAWSFSSLQVTHAPLLTAIAASAIPPICEFGPQD